MELAGDGGLFRLSQAQDGLFSSINYKFHKLSEKIKKADEKGDSIVLKCHEHFIAGAFAAIDGSAELFVPCDLSVGAEGWSSEARRWSFHA